MDMDVVTYFSSPTSKLASVKLLNQVMREFKDGHYRSRIEQVRDVLLHYGEEKYRIAKKSLPAIAFSGEFNGGHAKSNLVKHNDILSFDIDHLSAHEMSDARQKMIDDKYILAFWVSPSGNGYKGLVRINYENVPKNSNLDLQYKIAYDKVSEYFKDYLGLTLDSACSDFSRICYVCWDEHLFYRQDAKRFIVDCSLCIRGTKKINKRSNIIPIKSSSNITYSLPPNLKGKNKSRDRRIVASIVKYLSKRNLSITKNYHDWLKVGFAIANTFNFDLGLKYFVSLSQLDKGRFNENECKEKLLECYTSGYGEVTIGSIIEMAREKGFIYKGSSEGS